MLRAASVVVLAAASLAGKHHDTVRRRLSEFPACGVKLHLQESTRHSGRGLEDVYCATSSTLEFVLDKDEVPVYIGVGCCNGAGVCNRYAGATGSDESCFAGMYDNTNNVLGNPKTWDQAVELCHNEGKELCAAPLSNGICRLVGCNYDNIYQWSTTECEPGDANYQEECVSFVHVDQEMYYDDARAYCRANYHDLASIHSASENAEVDALCPGRCWIGGSDAARESTWTWSDGTAWDYENWDSGQPNNWWATNGEDLLEMYSDGTWNDNDDSMRTFVCSTPARTAQMFTFQEGRCYPQSEASYISTGGTIETRISETGTPQECYDYCADNTYGGSALMGVDLRPTGGLSYSGQACMCNRPSVKADERRAQHSICAQAKSPGMTITMSMA